MTAIAFTWFRTTLAKGKGEGLHSVRKHYRPPRNIYSCAVVDQISAVFRYLLLNESFLVCSQNENEVRVTHCFHYFLTTFSVWNKQYPEKSIIPAVFLNLK